MSTALKIAGVTLALFLIMGTASMAQDDQPSTHGGPIVGDDTPIPPPATHGGGPLVGGDKPLDQPGEGPDGDDPEPPQGGNGGGSGSPAETPTEYPEGFADVDATPSLSCGAIGWQGGGARDGVLRNIWFENTGAGPIYPVTYFTVVTSTGQEFSFEVDVTLMPGNHVAYSNVFPNGVPADFSCEVQFL